VAGSVAAVSIDSVGDQLWNLPLGAYGFNPLCVSPDGTVFATIQGGGPAYAFRDGTLLWAKVGEVLWLDRSFQITDKGMLVTMKGGTVYPPLLVVRDSQGEEAMILELPTVYGAGKAGPWDPESGGPLVPAQDTVVIPTGGGVLAVHAEVGSAETTSWSSANGTSANTRRWPGSVSPF
jgi:hypothetical protein